MRLRPAGICGYLQHVDTLQMCRLVNPCFDVVVWLGPSTRRNAVRSILSPADNQPPEHVPREEMPVF